jgi:hypothetical protein
MYKGDRTKEVADHEVSGQLKNGWAVKGEIKAVLRPVKKNTEDTPAVEVFASEQGENDEANLKENNDE